MDTDELIQHLTEFVQSRHAARLCRPYSADPAGALPDLYKWFTTRMNQPIRHPRACVRGYAVGLLRNYLKKECCQLRQSEESSEISRHRTPLSLSSLPFEIAAPEQEDAEKAEIREKVASAIRQLSTREREALEIRAGLSGETYRAMAVRYGVSPQTVWNWAEAAAAKLRPLLEGCL